MKELPWSRRGESDPKALEVGDERWIVRGHIKLVLTSKHCGCVCRGDERILLLERLNRLTIDALCRLDKR